MSEIKLTLEQRALLRAQEDDRDAIRNQVSIGVIPNINVVLPMYAAFAENMAGKYSTLAAQYTEDVGEAAALIPEFVAALMLVQSLAYQIDAAAPGLFGLEPLPQEPTP
jgi:hypothetical protein